MPMGSAISFKVKFRFRIRFKRPVKKLKYLKYPNNPRFDVIAKIRMNSFDIVLLEFMRSPNM